MSDETGEAKMREERTGVNEREKIDLGEVMKEQQRRDSTIHRAAQVPNPEILRELMRKMSTKRKGERAGEKEFKWPTIIGFIPVASLTS